MPSGRKIKVFRFIERFFIFLFVLWSGLICVAWSRDFLEFNEVIAGGGISFLLFMLYVYVQRTVDAWVTMYWSRDNYEQEDAFTALYNRSPVAYFTVDNRGRIEYANPAAIKLLQGEKSSVSGVNLFNLIQGNDQLEVEVIKSKMSSGVTINDQEFVLNTLGGAPLWVRISVHTFRNAGERLVSMVDVTEQKNIDTAKSEFVALATHQLRTPIAAIRWNVELLEKSVRATQTEAQSRYLNKINRNVLRMIDLINDFLSVSKLEMGTYAAQVVGVNMSDFFASVLDEFSEKIIDKQISVQRQENPPQTLIMADNRLLHIVVSNLVSNAVKYLGHGGTLTLSYNNEGANIKIAVADNGIGIPKEEVKNLFTKFYRASNAQAHQTEGTGLGLYIVKQSVEQMGGTIDVVSAENEGATFSVVLPTRT